MSKYKKIRFRSNFEKLGAEFLYSQKVKFEYETLDIEYTRPHKYKPDYILPNGIILEYKGKFTSSDRAKHLYVREQHPKLDIRLVFMAPNNKLYKGSKTTYSDWCDKHNIKWCKGPEVPKEWLKERKKRIILGKKE